jgi:uncharacterized protein (TIGR00251 family)
MIIEERKEGVVLNILVQPKSSRTEITGTMADHLKIKLTSPPTDNRANDELREFLSKNIGLPKRDILIIQGKNARRKRVLLLGVSPAETAEKLGL